MQRFKYHQKDWPAAISYIKKGKKTIDTPNWAIKFKDDLSVKGKIIYYKVRQQLVPREKVTAFLRKKIYDKSATVPFGRDSADISEECVLCRFVTVVVMELSAAL